MKTLFRTTRAGLLPATRRRPARRRACPKIGWEGLVARLRRQLAAEPCGGLVAHRNRPAACSTRFGVFQHAPSHLGTQDSPRQTNRALSRLLGLSRVCGGLALAQDQPPLITKEPQSRIVVAGSEVTFAVELAPNLLTPALQWYRSGSAVPGATNTTLVLPNLQAAQAGNYRVIATNAAGETSSATAALTMLQDESISGSLCI